MAVSLSNGQYTVKSGDAMERVVRNYLGPGATQSQVHDATVKVLATEGKTYANATSIQPGDKFDFSVIGAPKSGSGSSSAAGGAAGGTVASGGSRSSTSGTDATKYNNKKKTNYNSWNLADGADPFSGLSGFGSAHKTADKVSGKHYWPGY